MKLIHYTIEPKKKSIAKKYGKNEFHSMIQARTLALSIAKEHKCSVDIVMNIEQ